MKDCAKTTSGMVRKGIGMSLAPICLVVACTFSTNVPVGSLRMSASQQMNDTISPYETVRLCFSEPLADTIVPAVVFSPVLLDFYTVINQTRDTMSVIHTVPFPASSRIVIRTSTALVSKSGAVLAAGRDSVVFMTHAAEQEPNDDEATADSLAHSIYGSISTVHDIDWFVVNDTLCRAVALAPEGALATLTVFDAAGTIWNGSGVGTADTVRMDTGSMVPLHIRISSGNRSSGGFYRLQALAEI